MLVKSKTKSKTRRKRKRKRKERRYQNQLLFPFSSNHLYFPQFTCPIRPSRSIISNSAIPIATGEASEEVMKRHQDPKKVMNGNGSVILVKRVVRYRECRKNHAASVGGYAVDGCREFMASGEEGTTGAFNCAACNCHRSFHKREVEREVLCDCSSNTASPR